MCSQDTLHEILRTLRVRLDALLGTSVKDVILFGSYARNDADEGSDIDVMVLTDLNRADIANLNWKLGEIASDLLLEYGVLVSPIVESQTFFIENSARMPFFRNIRDEGVRISA
jgi:predicted nucleotidyltransferase